MPLGYIYIYIYIYKVHDICMVLDYIIAGLKRTVKYHAELFVILEYTAQIHYFSPYKI